MKRILAIILAVVMVFCLTACSGDTTDTPGENGGVQGSENGIVNLAANLADTFNPYTAKTTLNRNLCTLLFDPLVQIDGRLQPVNALADTITPGEKSLVVTLKSVTFTDGSALTADDVVYSFNLAKGSSDKYKSVLSTITSAEARDASSVIFKLSKADPKAAALLTFPIIKIGTDKLKNEDNVFLTPVGCGRYTLNSAQNGLVANGSWHGGKVNIDKINLINAPDNESLTHSVEIGAIDYYYTDLSDCNIIRMSGERVNVTLNNLVYLGLNLKTDSLQSANMRHAISAALDRKIIKEQGYYNNLIAATGLYLPSLSDISGVQTIENTANSKIAIENLEEIGYNIKENGYFLNSKGSPLTLSLLVNKENSFRMDTAKLIAAQLGAVGIKVNINAVSFSRYKELLAAGSFEIYLAEVNIPYNMDISPLVVSGGAAAYGIPKPSKDSSEGALSGLIDAYYNGTGGIQDIAVTANSELPIIPIGYRTGVLLTSNKIEVNSAASASDIFFGFENLKLK